MRVAFVVSDLSIPPNQGLHQQTLSLLSAFREFGWDVDVFGFVKDDSEIDLDVMRSLYGRGFASPPVRYRGSSVGQSLRLRSVDRRVRSELQDTIQSGEYDVVHLEGVVAASLLEGGEFPCVVVSMVDPGSRRHFRMARAVRKPHNRLKHFVAGIVFFAIERRSRGAGRSWHVVSSSDAEYLRRIHRYKAVLSIPILLPPEVEQAGRSGLELPAGVEGQKVRVLIFCDLRLSYMKLSLQEIAAQILQKIPAVPDVSYRVLGRTEFDDDLRVAFSGLDVTVIPWADDYFAEIRAADIVLLPDDVGTGLKTRTVQALYGGAPIVAGPAAFEGIPVVDEISAAIGRTHAELRSKFEDLCADAALRSRMGRAGHELASDLFSADVVGAQWRRHYESMTSRDIR